MFYAPNERKEVDNRVRAKFEDSLKRFCSEVPDHDFTRNPRGDYADVYVYGLFAGFLMNFLCEVHTKEGVKVDLQPGLLDVLPMVESYLPVQCVECLP